VKPVEHGRGGARRHPTAADPESSEEDATVQGEDVRKRSRKNFLRQRRSAKMEKIIGRDRENSNPKFWLYISC
jgi:hypothetical protein